MSERSFKIMMGIVVLTVIVGFQQSVSAADLLKGKPVVFGLESDGGESR